MFQFYSCIGTEAYSSCSRNRIPSDYCLMLYFVDTIMNLGVGVRNISRIQKTKDTAEMKEKLFFFFIYFRRGRLKAAAHPTIYSECS